MPYTIILHNQQKCLALDLFLIKRLISEMLIREKIRQADLSVVIATDRSIHSLNRRFLGHDYPTDVVTFDLSAREVSRKRKGKVITLDGEIYVSAVTAVRQARELGIEPKQELLLYIVHGILHLLGYDDHSPSDRKEMRVKEKEIMKAIWKKGNRD